MSVLVVVAHPDDESFFMGGTIAALAKSERVIVAALSDGVKSRPGWTQRQVIRRRDQFRRACEILGAEALYWPLFLDQRADYRCQLDLNIDIAALIAKRKPKTVYTHHIGDLNLDHRRVAEAVFVATRPGSSTVKRLFCMSPEWPIRCVGAEWRPKSHINIGATLGQKLRACLVYKQELRTYPHPRSRQAVAASTVESFMEIR